jgi:hypothetical protein
LAENGFGPPVTAPAARRSSIRSRVASAIPTESSVNGRPVGPITVAPAFTQRLASGMSAVTTTAPRRACAAIQSSAASKPAPTTTRSIRGSRGTARKLFETTKTLARCRSATRYTSALTGQASASTRMTIGSGVSVMAVDPAAGARTTGGLRR